LLNTVLGSFSSGVAASTSSYESIATATGTGSSGTITFSSIPLTYKHLQVRINLVASVAGGNIQGRFNGDTAANYASHYIRGDGSAAGASGTASLAFNRLGASYNGVIATYPSVLIIDITDYASTTKTKTLRSFFGTDRNLISSSTIELTSGLWNSTSAISSFEIYLSSGNYTTSSTFALYGIKG
jgi:hypothetical protein